MFAIASLLPLLLSIALVACFVKLAALVFRRTVVSWKSSFLFALILFVLTAAKFLSGLSLATTLPLGVAPLVGLAITLAAGSWFFSTRATTTEGLRIGWFGGLKLTSLSLALALAVLLPIVLAVRVLLPAP